ncbi:MAG TPA: MATE family efflux transporter [Lachnospiraceae bacterium]|nr:MATE family efflux transporter [Lachnospiraceae bacterium]
MHIQLSDHFNYGRLLRFTFPSMIMMIFTSIYSVVDGFFVSNFVGKTSFAAVNFIMPVLMILGSTGFMFGSGGGALVSKTMGEGDTKKARQLFSLFVYSTAVCGAILAVAGFLFIRPLAAWMGAEGELLDSCVVYARILLLSLPFFMLQFEFQSFFIAAERPQLGLFVTVACGIMNMVLDALFMAVFSWGLQGAAAATMISQVAGGLIPILYFCRRDIGVLYLTRTNMDKKALLKACTNGSSELMSNVSISLVSMLYNFQLMRYAGEDGIAAYGVVMYVNMIFLAIFIGYSTGSAPVVSYHYGAGDSSELKGLLRKSYVIIGVFAVLMFGLAELLAGPLARIFVGYDRALMDMTKRAFMIYSFSFLFSGLAIYGSSFFTALNDGLTSALISFLRSLLFQAAAVLIFPLFFGIDGIWLSVVAAELVAAIMTALFIAAKKEKYHY